MPISSSLGHRSQTNAEIRHISGRNISEFTEFLLKHTDVFRLKDDYVMLRCVLDQVDENGENVKIKRVVEEAPIDPYLMQQLVFILEETIIKLTRTAESNEDKEVYLNVLFDNIIQTCKSELWSKLVSTTSDPHTILKMNSKLLCVQSITEERIGQLKRPSTTSTNNSNLNSSSTAISSSSSNASSSVRIVNTAQNGNRILITLQQRMRSQIIKTLNEKKSLNGQHNYANGNRKSITPTRSYESTVLSIITTGIDRIEGNI